MSLSFTSRVLSFVFLFFFTFSFSQSVCDIVVPVCSNENIVSEPIQHTPITMQASCVTMAGADEVQWYFVKISSGTTFTFVISPNNNVDYDFMAWLNPSDCNNLGLATRASYDWPDVGQYDTGLLLNETGTCEDAAGTGVEGMVRHLDVVPGDEIIIAVYRFSGSGGFELSFGGDSDLDCTIIGENYGQCDYDGNNQESFDLDIIENDITEGAPNQTVDFYEIETDAQAGNSNTESSPYTAIFNDGDGDGLDDGTVLYGRLEENGVFIRLIQVTLFVNRLPNITSPVSLDPKCDIGDDGAELFDLTEAEALLVTDPSLYLFSYYEDEDDADAGNPNFINPANAYSSGTATIYVRVETGALVGNDQGCYTVGEINLQLDDFGLDALTITPDALCDDDGDGEVIVDLTQYIDDLVAAPNNPDDYTITYFEDPFEASVPTNNILDPENFPIIAGNNDVIYVRIEHPTNGCFIISEISLSTLVRPVLNAVDTIAICVDETSGEYLFDLTVFDNQIVANPNDFTITYHESQAEADTGDNPINPENAYPIDINSSATVYIRVDAGGCPNTGSVIININSNPVLEEDLEIGPLCDEDGDGEVIVDFTENESYFIGGDAGPFDIITYHTNQTEAETGDNPIPNYTNYPILAGTTFTVYIRVKYQNNECNAFRTITYNVVERPELNDLDDITECVDQINGDASYDLTLFNPLVVNNPENYEISYHTNPTEAQSGDNPITNFTNYPIPLNTPTEIFIRVQADGCADYRSVLLTFNSNPVITDLDNQAFCSTEISGTIPYDLTQHQSEWVIDPNLYQFSYHISQLDADNDDDPILNPSNHPIQVGVTTTIFVRIENLTTGCFSTTILTLYPGTTATLNDGLEIELCDENFDGTFTYNLTELNSQLILNPAGLNFQYFLSLSNAQSNENPIPQNQWNNYSINTLPFEIWVVATTNDECRSEPVKVAFLQGDYIDLISAVLGPKEYCIENQIDLNSFESEITNESVNFSYHNSLSDAENALNPISNTTEFNPQGNNSVYVRLEMAGRCPVIVEIQFEQLQTPSIKLNQTSFALCPGSTFEATASSDDASASFVWYLDEIEIGSGSTISISENGTYTVIVTGVNGCINEETLTISTPPTPIITGIEMGPNYVIVSGSSGDGGGSLEYSLDGVLWQNSPQFNNLIPGEVYTIYVREDGCMMDSYEVVILSITNFVSPNNDGKNDTWEIRGIEVTQGATIKIFDRFGKIFVDRSFGGNYQWDGQYLGNNVPSGDYWYIIQIPSDGIIKDQKFVGHISVRNQ